MFGYGRHLAVSQWKLLFFHTRGHENGVRLQRFSKKKSFVSETRGSLGTSLSNGPLNVRWSCSRSEKRAPLYAAFVHSAVLALPTETFSLGLLYMVVIL